MNVTCTSPKELVSKELVSKKLVLKKCLRARLHGKRVPIGDRGTLPTRFEDTVVLQAKFEGAP